MGKKKKVEVVVPIYNEEQELEANIIKLHSFLTKKLHSYVWEITIADNASTDKSLKIAKTLSAKLPNTHAFHLDEKGRGRAVKRAWERSSADYLAYMDVDLSTDLASFPHLLVALDKGYDIAIGSRLLTSSKVINRTPKREILSRCYNILIKVLFDTHFSDAQCGFKVVSKNVVKKLLPHVRDEAWFFDSEFLILAEKLGYKIFEEPVVWVDNPGSTVRVLGTVRGDLEGLWRLFHSRPWQKLTEKK